MTTYRLGNLYATQLEGLPIGGPVSFAVLDSVLSFLENTFIDHSWTRWATTLYVATTDIRTLVAQSRYVDDLLFESLGLCQKCLESLIKFFYCSHCEFDINTIVQDTEGGIQVRYLDLWLQITRDPSVEGGSRPSFTMTTGPFNANEDYGIPRLWEVSRKYLSRRFHVSCRDVSIGSANN